VVFKMDGANPPAVRVHAGDIVVVDCVDGYGGVIKTETDNASKLDFDSINPATGPIYVEEAEPGDVLVAQILSIETAAQGAALVIPGYGLLKDEINTYFTKIAKVEAGRIRYREDVELPLKPMIGTFGVAPAGEGVSCLFPGDHGSNMDIKDVCAGSTVYLPVFVPGALLALGDAKATIGDGELGAAGLESDILATLRLDVVKGSPLPRPMIETQGEIMTCGTGKTMEEALKVAVRDMVGYLSRKLNLAEPEAYNLVSLVGDARPGNVVTEVVSMRVAVPKSIFVHGITVP
jgi:amidase